MQMNKAQLLETMNAVNIRWMADSLEKISPESFGLLITSLRWHATRLEAGEFREQFLEYIYAHPESTLSECYKCYKA